MNVIPKTASRAAIAKPFPAHAILAAMSLVILGKDRALRLVLAAVLARGHVLLNDLPGVGKTTLSLGLARLLGLDFARVQMTVDLLPGDILGTSVYNPKEQHFVFHPGPIFHEFLLIDEINRASPRTQSALLEAMAEGQVTVDGHGHPLPAAFLVIATQNPQEHAGVFPLPESQLDRFMISISLGYPDMAAERRLLNDEQDVPEHLHPVIHPDELLSWYATVDDLFVSSEIREMLLQLAQASRHDPELACGLSPRGLLALLRMTRAWAALSGRDFVAPDDLQAVTVAVIGHRLQVANGSDGALYAAQLMQREWGLAPLDA